MIRRLILASAVGLFVLALATNAGYGNYAVWLLCCGLLVLLLTRIALRLRRVRRIAQYGPGLKHAMSILLDRNKWADLMEILGLSVDADIRRSRSLGILSGVGAGERQEVRYIPKVAAVTEAPYGLRVTVVGAPGQSAEMWQRRSGQIRSALRVPEVIISEPCAGHYELGLRVRNPLAEPVILPDVPRMDGWLLRLGINEDGGAVAAPCRNVSGVVVGGLPGRGKSAWLASMLGSFAHRHDVQMLLIDGKQGYDLECLAPRAYRYLTGDEAGDLNAVREALQDVQALMRHRLGNAKDIYGQSNLWSAGPSRPFPIVFVVIDECQAYLDLRSFSVKEDKALASEIDSIVRDLVKRGRSAGIIVVLSTQRPTADSIPTSTRDNCGLRVCFSVATREAATAVLGEFTADSPLSPIGCPVGVGVASVDGWSVKFRSPYVPEALLERVVGDARQLTADPLDLMYRAVVELTERIKNPWGTDAAGPDKSDTSRLLPAREPLD